LRDSMPSKSVNEVVDFGFEGFDAVKERQ
jgi:hypothetical protein